MPRANRYMFDGLAYHITHRCLNQEFLLKFEKDRREYYNWLVEGVSRFKVPVFAYCLLSNHIHLIVKAESAESVADLIHLAAGSTARSYNRRKERSGAFWDDQYKCTAIENGRHLLNCIAYIHLNPVRAGIANHPRDWLWCGHSEFTETRKRKKILDVGKLLECLEGVRFKEFMESYEHAINERIDRSQLEREPDWSDSLAVGSNSFVIKMKGMYKTRAELDVVQVPDVAGEPRWAVREIPDSYLTKTGGEKRK